MSNYWQRLRTARPSRRRFLGATAAGASAAAFLAACGSDDSPGANGTTPAGTTGSGGQNGNGLVTQPVDTFDQAVRGGTLRDYVTAEPQTLDPGTPISPLNQFSRHVYGTLFVEEPGHMEPATGQLRGDMAESYEISPDRLQITIKLRPGVKWHNKSPVNGREADIDDVIFSWQRYINISPFRGLAYNGVNPDAPVISVEPGDNNNIVVTLAEPLSYALNYFGAFGSHTGNMIMFPREADGGFDPRHEMIGHGPFELSEAVSSVGYTFRRHAEYHDPDFALVDQINAPIVPEYAARIAQLKAGNIHRLLGNDPQGEDVVITKRDESRLNIFETDIATPNKWIMIFGVLPAGESPFLDERVRQAVSMSIDRDAWIDAMHNVSGFEADGLPVENWWNSHLTCIWQRPDYWMDPRSEDFGPNARYFQYNPEEARRLLDAAGYGSGLTVTSNYPVQTVDIARWAEPIDGMIQNVGINLNINTPDYVSDYIPNYRDGNGQYQGWAYSTVTGTMPQVLHPASAIAAEYWSKGGAAFRGFSASGQNDQAGDPELDRMIEAVRLEYDSDELRSKLHDIQRYLAQRMWGLNLPGGATRYTLAWPAVQNFPVWRMQPGVVNSLWDTHKLWLDSTRAPLA